MKLKSADDIIKGADIIGGLRQQAGEPKAIKPPTSNVNPTTKPLTSQELEPNNAIKSIETKELESNPIQANPTKDIETNKETLDNIDKQVLNIERLETRRNLKLFLIKPMFRFIHD